MDRITREVFFEELKTRKLSPEDFFASIENNFNTSMRFKEFNDDFERKGHLTASREAAFKMYLNFYDDRIRNQKIKKKIRGLGVLVA